MGYGRRSAFGDFVQGLSTGYGLGDKLRQRAEQEDIAKAANTYSPTEQMSGQDVQSNIEANFVPQDGGPQTAAEFIAQTPGVSDVVNNQRAQFNVGNANYDTREAATAAARGLNMAAMAEAYRRQGRPEEAIKLESQAQENELRGLQLSKAKADNESLQKYKNVLDAMRTPENAANWIESEYNANRIGQPGDEQFNLQKKPVKGGYMAWQTTKDGEVVPGSSKYFDNDEIVRTAQMEYLRQVDPTGSLKLDIDERRRGEDRAWDREKFQEQKRHTGVVEDLSRRQLALSGAAAGRAESAESRAAQEFADKKQKEAEIANLRQTYALTVKNNPVAAKDVADKLWYEYGTDVDGRSGKIDPLSTHLDTVNGQAIVTDPKKGSVLAIPTNGNGELKTLYERNPGISSLSQQPGPIVAADAIARTKAEYDSVPVGGTYTDWTKLPPVKKVKTAK